MEGHSAVSGWMEIIFELDISEVEEEEGEVIIDPMWRTAHSNTKDGL